MEIVHEKRNKQIPFLNYIMQLPVDGDGGRLIFCRLCTNNKLYLGITFCADDGTLANGIFKITFKSTYVCVIIILDLIRSIQRRQVIIKINCKFVLLVNLYYLFNHLHHTL